MNISLNIKTILLFTWIVFSSGFFPKIWSEGIKTPIFKKGKYNDCNNYSGKTLVSCLSKIFTSILNKRLKNWSENYDIISDAQFGFNSTTDAIFVLHWLISRRIAKRKKCSVVLWIIKKLLIKLIEIS